MIQKTTPQKMKNKPKCQCGCTNNPEGYCDGSHLN